MVTLLGAAGGVIGAFVASQLKLKTIDIGMVGNGMIAGLVAITAPSGYVEAWAGPIIGFVAGLIVVFGVIAIDKKLDDPIGALSAHGLAGVWGTLACGLFTAPRLAQYNAFGDPDGGLFYSGEFDQLIAQAVGVLIAFAFVFALSFAHVRDHQGDDRAARDRGGGGRRARHRRARHVRLPGAVHPAARDRGRVDRSGLRHRRARRPSPRRPQSRRGRGGDRMKKIEAFIRHEAFEPIRMELLDRGFPSLSIAEYKGSGRQKGITEQYRGSELTIHLRPKLKLEIVVEDKDVSVIVETILKHARTGQVGDGKIFVLPVEDADPHPHRRGRGGRAPGPRDGGDPGGGLIPPPDLPMTVGTRIAPDARAAPTWRWWAPCWRGTASSGWPRSPPRTPARPSR